MRFEDQRDEIIEDLTDLMQLDGEYGFLILSAGNVYAQFVPIPDENAIYIETVSNTFLPESHLLSTDRIKMLTDMGFDPPNESPNFSMSYDMSDEEAFDDIVELIFDVFKTVYDIAPDEPLEIEMNVEE